MIMIGNYSIACVADEYRRDDFPTDFVFGSGTSAYQVTFHCLFKCFLFEDNKSVC